MKHAKHDQPILDYLFAITSLSQSSHSSATGNELTACSTLINYLFELNPGHLIKCAQKYTDLVS
ncbi:hypothetical protein ACMBCN_01680, partial [Candidatus Liberibacter asiaticus]|nr:hypothetical protein [Candidatus Liberibacter asiaticus]